jgi:hypothetical protein
MFKVDQFVTITLLPDGATLEGFFQSITAAWVLVEQHVQDDQEHGIKPGVYLQAVPIHQIVMITADTSTDNKIDSGEDEVNE